MNFAPFLRAFALALLLCIGAVAAVLAYAGADFPAPHFSRSASFNEKARWLRGALAEGPRRDGRCEVLVAGSSMALNSVDGSLLAAGGERVINLSSFGVTPEDTVEMLRIVLPLCRPKTILMAAYQGDFRQWQEQKDIAWDRVRSYLTGGSDMRAHLADFDPWYLVERSLAASELHRTDTYMSLAFDRTGGARLDCTTAYRMEKRWNADLLETVTPARPEALAAMGEIARMARAAGARLVIAVPPLRPRAERNFYPAERDALWRAVSAAIAPAGGTLVRPAGNAGFTDAEFADYAHLNRCGAARWTRLVRSDMERTGR